MDQPRLKAVAKALFIAAFALFTAAVFEAGVRATRLDTVALKPLLSYQHAVLPVHEVSPDLELLYGLRPGSSGTYADHSFSVNSLGFRDPPRPARKPPGTVRIACLGASYMFGALVDDGETFPRRLEETLNRHFRGRFEVWNAGVNAYQVSQEAAAARRFEASYSPDLMLFHLNSLNRRSFLEGQPYESFFRRDPRLYLENLGFLPLTGGRLGLALLRHCALYRAASVYANYPIARLQPRPGYAREMNLEAWGRYLSRSPPSLPKVLLFLGGGRGLNPSGDLPEIPLYRGPGVPAALPADYFLVHPPARVYRLQAQIVAERLAALYPNIFRKKDRQARIVEPLASLEPPFPLTPDQAEESAWARRAAEVSGPEGRPAPAPAAAAADEAPPQRRSAPSAPQADPLIDRADRYSDQGRADLALALLAGSSSPRARHRRALALQRLGRYAEARELLDALRREAPQEAAYLKDLAICEYLSGRAPAAIRDLERCLRLAPGMLSAYQTLGTILQARGNRAEALRLYRRALSLPASRDPALRAQIRETALALERRGGR